MRNDPVRWPMLAGVLAVCAVVSLAPHALAGVGEGDAAPAFEGKEFVNTPAISMKDLRGQVILYEIFRTW